MDELIVHIWHVILWEFKNKDNVTKTANKICSFYAQGVITDRQIQNWSLKFRSGNTSVRDELGLGCSSNLD